MWKPFSRPVSRALKAPAKFLIRLVYPRIKPYLRAIHARLEGVAFAERPDDADSYFWKIHAVIEKITGGEGVRMLSDEGDAAGSFHLIVRRTGRHFRIARHPASGGHVLSEQVRRRWRVVGGYDDPLRAAYACAALAVRERESSRRGSRLLRGEGTPVPPMFDIGSQWRSERHRAGWGVAIDALASLHGEGLVKLDTFVESNFLWQRSHSQVYEEPWVGFVHNPPNIPDLACYNGLTNQDLFDQPAWRKSLQHCQGLFVLSEYHKRQIESRLPVRVEALVHPTAPPRRKFSLLAFLENPDKKLVQIGVWLRNPLGLEKVETSLFRKVRLHSGIPGHEQVLRSLGADPAGPSSVGVLPYQDDDAYDELLSRNAGFLNLFEASAANTVVECIVRETPLLVNRLPALEEYLGRDYPLFYEDLGEASRKSDDIALIRAAHEYLQALPKERFTPEHFRRAFVNSEIVRSLDAPKRHILVFAQARTGSTALLDALRTHPRVKLLGEPFNPQRAASDEQMRFPRVRDIRGLRKALRQIEGRFHGFKHLSGQFHWVDREFNHELLRRGYDVILLTRGNLLQGAISNLISLQTRHWGKDRSRLLEHDFEPIPLDKIEGEMASRREQADHYRAFLTESGVRFLDLSYESLFGPALSLTERLAALDAVFGHLDLRPPRTASALARLTNLLDPAQSKLNNADTYARIPNIAEIERAFSGEGWGYLHDSAPDRPRRTGAAVLGREVAAPMSGAGTVTSAPKDGRVIAHFAQHKVGTVLFARILGEVAIQLERDTGTLHRLERRQEAPEPPLAPGSVYLFPRGRHADLRSLRRNGTAGSLVASRLIRDPRDVVVSAYHYHLRTGETWCNAPDETLGGRSYREHLNGLPQQEGLLFEMGNSSRRVIQALTSWPPDEPGVLTLRFEDMVGDFDRTTETLLQHYGFGPEASQRLRNRLSRHDPARMTEERLRANAHISGRNPVGRWREHFTPELKHAFRAEFPGVLVQLGYERDDDW